jgi:hypothetical protein
LDNSRIERSTIVIALDRSNRKVLFEQGPTIGGVAYHMFAKLVEQRGRDVAAGISSKEFGYVKTIELGGSNHDGDALRQRVHEAKKKLSRWGLKDVIQSRRSFGYRLGPPVVVASVEQIRSHREISDA